MRARSMVSERKYWNCQDVMIEEIPGVGLKVENPASIREPGWSDRTRLLVGFACSGKNANPCSGATCSSGPETVVSGGDL